MLPSYHNTWGTTAIGTTTGDGYPGNYVYIDDGTGGHHVTTYAPYGMEAKPIDHTYAISKEVSKKDLKAMKDEIQKYMKDQMLEDAKEIAGQLFEDIEKLKKEKTQLEKSVTELKNQVEQVQKNVKNELLAIEELIDKRVQRIGKFAQMDFSQS